jgi:tRNA threonylcarbamoyladenosine biosynthesis protein TsaE
MAGHHKLQVTRFLADEAATLGLGAELASGLSAGMVIYLQGELGSGKTTLVRGLLRALGVTDRVKSPTYTLVELYSISSLYLYHFDFYRFKRSEEWSDAGFRDCFHAGSVCVVEWPEKAGGQLPAADVTVRMEMSGSGRSTLLTATTEAGIRCLTALRN